MAAQLRHAAGAARAVHRAGAADAEILAGVGAERLPLVCFRLAGLTRLLRDAGLRDRFGPIGHDRYAHAWDRLAAAPSTRLRDRWRHAAMVHLLTGAKPRMAGAGLALVAGAALGFALAG